jgi:hypothetical protein
MGIASWVSWATWVSVSASVTSPTRKRDRVARLVESGRSDIGLL